MVDEKVYLNLDEWKEQENPKFEDYKLLCERRTALKEQIERDTLERKKIDEMLLEFVDSWGVDGLVVDEFLAEKRVSRSAGKWNKDRISMVLTPDQMEKVYTPGGQYSFIQITDDPRKVERARKIAAAGD
tara:strand:+ start:7923 stop:8312 length:390 start_codon:yes stop_codon:yes gene_type:complete